MRACLAAVRRLYLDGCLIPGDDTQLTGTKRAATDTSQSPALATPRCLGCQPPSPEPHAARPSRRHLCRTTSRASRRAPHPLPRLSRSRLSPHKPPPCRHPPATPLGEAEPAKPRSSLRHAPPRPLTRPAAAGGLLPVLPWPLRAAGCSCGRCWRCWRCWQLPGPRSTEPSITPGRSAEMGPSCAPRRLVQREQVRGRR